MPRHARAWTRQAVFDTWNQGELDSYLIEITAQILKFKDADGSPLVEKIRDTAGQKGTGKWTGIEALEQVSATIVTRDSHARSIRAIGTRDASPAAAAATAPIH